MHDTFERIINRELPADIVYESDHIIAIKDIAPVAPVHLLIITKKKIASVQAMQSEDLPLMQEIVQVAQQLAKEHGIEEAYRLITNNGSRAGQIIRHLHFHLIGGRQLGHLG
jgi:histidine triad (HIT) family protein